MTLVVLPLGACGGGGSSAQEEADKARPLPEVDKALRPDEYRSEEFKPSVSFHVGKGWTNFVHLFTERREKRSEEASKGCVEI